VDIAEGERFVAHIRKAVKTTYSRSVIGDVGLFGGFFDARFTQYKSPVLVSSVDGVGTKLLVAQMMNKHDTIGQDLVNHCVNDIVVCGAEPLFLLEYFATGKLREDVAREVMTGFVKACKENRCALIGGETAEMPGLYEGSAYDLSGTIVGVVERKAMITGRSIKAGDVLLGLPSTGLHTNGYSLARAVLLSKYSLDQKIDELGERLGDVLLRVHRSYRDIVSTVLEKFHVKGLAHITGGGIVGNTKRILGNGLGLAVDWGAWKRPAIFELIQRKGNVSEEEMRRTFNLGIGLILVVARRHSDVIRQFIRRSGEECHVVGEVVRTKKILPTDRRTT
jgi:phosphoribosylformylglycinamidine cyclo-ligase